MYRAHREERKRARNLLNEAHSRKKAGCSEFSDLQIILVEEAIAHEKLWEVRYERWLCIQDLEKEYPGLSEEELLYRYQTLPLSSQRQVQELREEKNYYSCYDNLVRACDALESEIKA